MSTAKRTDDKTHTKFWSGFIGGIACTAIVWLCIRYVPCLGMGISPIPRFFEIKPGMTRQQVEQVLGEEDGSISGKELISYYQHRYVSAQIPTEYSKPSSEVRHLLWLSRFNCLLIFNVVTIDKDDLVVSTDIGYDTFFGIK